MGQKHSAGKGSVYRPVDKKKYDENYGRIFGKKVKEDEAIDDGKKHN